MVGVGAAYEQAGVTAIATGLDDAHAGDGGERLGQGSVAARLDGGAVDHGDAGGDLLDQGGHAGGGDYDVWQGWGLGVNNGSEGDG